MPGCVLANGSPCPLPCRCSAVRETPVLGHDRSSSHPRGMEHPTELTCTMLFPSHVTTQGHCEPLICPQCHLPSLALPVSLPDAGVTVTAVPSPSLHRYQPRAMRPPWNPALGRLHLHTQRPRCSLPRAAAPAQSAACWSGAGPGAAAGAGGSRWDPGFRRGRVRGEGRVCTLFVPCPLAAASLLHGTACRCLCGRWPCRDLTVLYHAVLVTTAPGTASAWCCLEVSLLPTSTR